VLQRVKKPLLENYTIDTVQLNRYATKSHEEFWEQHGRNTTIGGVSAATASQHVMTPQRSKPNSTTHQQQNHASPQMCVEMLQVAKRHNNSLTVSSGRQLRSAQMH
jgi:hypothetical protein